MTTYNPGGESVPPAELRGKGLIIAGSVLLIISILGFTIAMAVLAPKVDVADFERTIDTSGSPSSSIPGTVDFRILEPLSGESVSVDVGIAFESDVSTGSESCVMHTASGEEIPLGRGGSFETFLDPDFDSEPPALVARSLSAGSYSVSCDSSSTTSGTFFVARSVSADELIDLAKPLLGVVAATLISGVMFLLGLILFIVGLVKRNRSKRSPPPSPGYLRAVVPSAQPAPEVRPDSVPEGNPPGQPRPPYQSDWQPPT